jgi:PAS domain-containing protein
VGIICAITNFRHRLPSEMSSLAPVSPQDHQELHRLADLYRTQLLDSPPEPELDALVGLGARVFNSAYCLVSLVDHDRLWFKAKSGLASCGVDRSISFCTHTIQSDAPYQVDDTLKTPLFANNPLVRGPLALRSYLGIPLRCSTGSRIGSFCVMDINPRAWSSEEIQIARKMARLAELLLHKSSHSCLGQAIPGVDVNAVWSRDLSGDKIVLDSTLSRLLGFSKESVVVKDWFTRQVFDCDRERVLEERCRASGEPFEYQMGLADGTVLKVCEHVKIVNSDSVSIKRGFMSIHVVGKSNPRMTNTELSVADSNGHAAGFSIPDSCELQIWPDYSANFIDTDKHTDFRLLDFLHPTNIADLLQACKSVRCEGGQRQLTVQLKNKSNCFRAYLLDLSWDSNDPASGAGLFRATANLITSSTKLDLNSLYDSSLSTALKAPGLFYHQASGQVHVSQALQKTLGLPGLSPGFDEVLSALELFSGKPCRSIVDECLKGYGPQKIEFKWERFGSARWYQMLLDTHEDQFESVLNLSLFLIDVSESRAAMLDVEVNYFTRDLILQNVSDGLLELDDSNSIVFANRQARTCLFGRPEGIRSGLNIKSVFSGLEQSTLDHALSEMKYQGASAAQELYAPATGKAVRVRFIRGHNANFCVLNDVSDHHRNLQLLRFAREALALCDAPVVLLEVGHGSTSSHRFVYVNDAFGRQFKMEGGISLNADPEWFATAIFGHSGKRNIAQALMKWQNTSVPLRYVDQCGVIRPCVAEIRPSTDLRSMQRHVLIVIRHLQSPQ